MGRRKWKSVRCESHLGYWLRFVSNHVSHAFSLKLQARGVTAAEWVVLRALFGVGRAPSELADHLGMTRGAISNFSDRLIAKALVTRRANAGDRRFQSLTLPVTGASTAPKLALGRPERRGVFRPSDRSTRGTIETAMKDIVAARNFGPCPSIERRRRGDAREGKHEKGVRLWTPM